MVGRNGTVSLLHDILFLMEAAAQMMSDVYGEALAACILNMFHGQVNCGGEGS